MTALVLLALGVHDLAAVTPGRAARRPWLRLVAAVVAVLAGIVALTLSAGAGPGTLASASVALGAACGWHGLAAAGRPVWRTAALGAVVVLAVAEHTGGLDVSRAPVGLTLLAAGLVLVETANVATRDVLALAGRPSGEADPAPQGEDDATGLRGGRFIGPMERLLMVVLGLMAAWQVVAAIMAAKGIVRFPEISRDARSHEPKGGPPGASAEEFLIGSLASWTLAAGAGLLVHLALTAR
ncbi:hypothetical protein [Micrococcus lacusdianchii]|uniref:hypothetical protein n=1 Tax=Micrococcus lacusdianchii TaxID=2915940 RepID=UPI0020034CD8|nr:hypothetical protein [Micrococcus sp. JXJ CY 30]